MTPRKRQQEPPATEPRAQDQEATAGSGGRKPLREMTIKEIQEGYNDLTEEEQARVQRTALKTLQIATGNRAEIREAIEEITQKSKDTREFVKAAGEFLANTAQMLQEAAQKAREVQQQFKTGELWQKLQAEYPGISESNGILVAFMADDLLKYAPEIKRQMQEYETEDGEPLTFNDLLEIRTPEPENITLLEKFLANVVAIREAERGLLPKVTTQKPTKAGWPVDKINGYIWNLLEQDTNGQLTFAMESLRGKRPKKALDLIYSIDFTALEGAGVKVSKRLTPTDKRVYIAISALYNAGNKTITLSQIHEAMGNTRRPSKNQTDRINESVYKMARAWIRVDNTAEHEAYSYDIDEHRADGKGWTGGKYDGPLLPIERAQVIVNGQLAEAAIHLFREPPMLTFAKLRNQITTIDIKLLQSPASKTDGNLLIEDYLLTRIARAKNNKKSEKILFKTLYEKSDIEDKKQRQRGKGKIETYLKYYQQEGFIKSYTMEPDGVTVYFEGQ